VTDGNVQLARIGFCEHGIHLAKVIGERHFQGDVGTGSQAGNPHAGGAVWQSMWHRPNLHPAWRDNP
jgi:hypothetical protein